MSPPVRVWLLPTLLSLLALPDVAAAQGRRGSRTAQRTRSAVSTSSTAARSRSRARPRRQQPSQATSSESPRTQALAHTRRAGEQTWTLNGKPIRVWGDRFADGSYGTTYFTDALAPRQRVDVMTPTGPAQLVGISRPTPAERHARPATPAPAPPPVSAPAPSGRGGSPSRASGGFWGGPHEGRGGFAIEVPGGVERMVNDFDLQTPLDRATLGDLERRADDYRRATPERRRFMEQTGIYGSREQAEHLRLSGRLVRESQRADRVRRAELEHNLARQERLRPKAGPAAGGLRSAIAARHFIEKLERQNITLRGREISHLPKGARGGLLVGRGRPVWAKVRLYWNDGAAFYRNHRGDLFQVDDALVRDLLRGAPRTLSEADIDALAQTGVTSSGTLALGTSAALATPPASRGLKGPKGVRGTTLMRHGTEYSLYWKGSEVYIQAQTVRDFEPTGETWYKADPQSVDRALANAWNEAR